MTRFDSASTEQQPHWRERRRLLLAILAITLLYLAIQEVWLWGAAQLAHQGWTVNDPAETFASEAAEVAEISRQREAGLAPDFPHNVFQLGLEYGYLSQWLGGYGQQPDEIMRQLSRPVEGHLRHLEQLAEQLAVAPVVRLPMVTAADYSGLTQRIEADSAGVAARIGQVGSPRLRHLFLFAAHVGTEVAALESAGDLMPIPATALIGQHATLAGVPEVLWRPLSRQTGSSREEIRRAYLEAVVNIDSSLLPRPAPAPNK